MSEGHTQEASVTGSATTSRRRRNPFLETAPEPIPNPVDYASGQRAPAHSPPTRGLSGYGGVWVCL